MQPKLISTYNLPLLRSLAIDPSTLDGHSPIQGSLRSTDPLEHHVLTTYNQPIWLRDAHSAERVKVFSVQSPIDVARVTAWSFLKWAKQHESTGGVITLPTGRTPRYFIEQLESIKKNWTCAENQSMRNTLGMEGTFPTFENFQFFQLDEFIGIDTTKNPSFTAFIRTYYQPVLGLRNDQLHFMNTEDIVPRGTYQGKHSLIPYHDTLNQWCRDYETRYQHCVEEHNGAVYILGGIGMDAHIGFNMPDGTNKPLPTCVQELSYMAAACNATGHGHVDHVKKRMVVTMGMKTLKDALQYNPKNSNCVIFATGNDKADALATATVDTPTPACPASYLQELPNVHFVADPGALNHSELRLFWELHHKSTFTIRDTTRVLSLLSDRYDCSYLDLPKKIQPCDQKWIDLITHRMGHSFEDLANQSIRRICQHIHQGESMIQETPTSRRLDTEPHDDDLLLGPYAYLTKLYSKIPKENILIHTATPGFTAVTHSYVMEKLDTALEILNDSTTDIVTKSLEDVLENLMHLSSSHDDPSKLHYALSKVFIKALMRTLSSSKVSDWIKDTEGGVDFQPLLEEPNEFQRLKLAIPLLKHYFSGRPNAGKDHRLIEELKGNIRRCETLLAWQTANVPLSQLKQGRYSYYQGKTFEAQPSSNDIHILVNSVLRQHNPDVISATDDPEGSGPSTHFRVLMHIADSLHTILNDPNEPAPGTFDYKLKNGQVKIELYRNVWSEYQEHELGESAVVIALTEDELKAQDNTFCKSYSSQVNAPYPCPAHENKTFSDVSRHHYQRVKERVRRHIGQVAFDTLPLAYREAAGWLIINVIPAQEFVDTVPRIASR